MALQVLVDNQDNIDIVRRTIFQSTSSQEAESLVVDFVCELDSFLAETLRRCIKSKWPLQRKTKGLPLRLQNLRKKETKQWSRVARSGPRLSETW